MERDETPKAALKKDRRLSPLERMIAGVMADDLTLGNAEDGIQNECPNLWGWLSVTAAGKGHVMPTGTLTLQLVPGGAVATLRHQGLGKSLEAGSDTLAGSFMALEELLRKANPPLKNLGKGEPKIRKRKTAT